MTEPTPVPAFSVRDDATRRRYEALLGDAVVGFADYHVQPGLVTILHTEIDRACEGRGLGSALMAGILDDVRSRDLRVFPVCPFMRGYLRRHVEHRELVWKP
jgi:uncharacterized protein